MRSGLLALCLLGCSGAGATGGGGGPPAACAGHERELAEGGCAAIGVTLCAEGFVTDDAGGCEPILPASPCPDGAVALPGETSCRPLTDCGSGRWGNIPLEPGAVYVDAAAPSGGDGSEAAPLSNVLAAVAQVPDGGLIVVAEGTYVGDVPITAKAVRLWGRCPDLVSIVGDGSTGLALSFTSSFGSELHGVSVTGPGVGVSIAGSVVTVDGVRVHDTASFGFDAESLVDGVSGTQAFVTNLLVERATAVGLHVVEATVVAEGIVVRDTQPTASGTAGRGVNVQGQTADTSVSIERCVVERQHEAGVAVADQPLSLGGCVVRHTDATVATGSEGRGISVQAGALSLAGSLVDDNTEFGIFAAVGSVIAVEQSVVRRTASSATTMRHGSGISLQRSDGDVRDSLLATHRDFGVVVFDGALALTNSIVRDVSVAADGRFGDGVSAVRDVASTSAQVRGNIIERSARAGLSSFGSVSQVADTSLRCNPIALNGEDVGGGEFSFEDLGGNACACEGEVAECKVQSAGLEPPSAPP